MSDALAKIEAALEYHVGPENAITAPQLARKLRMPEREVRRLIASSPDFQPCAKAGEGFFLPTDVEQIYDHDTRLAAQESAIRRRRKLFRQFHEKQGIHFPRPSK